MDTRRCVDNGCTHLANPMDTCSIQEDFTVVVAWNANVLNCKIEFCNSLKANIKSASICQAQTHDIHSTGFLCGSMEAVALAKEINSVKHECTFIAHEMSICKACPQCCAKLNKIIFNYAEGMQLYHANNILHIIAQEERFLSFYSRQFLAESERRNSRTLRFNCVSPTHPNGVNQDNNPLLLGVLAVVSDFHMPGATFTISQKKRI